MCQICWTFMEKYVFKAKQKIYIITEQHLRELCGLTVEQIPCGSNFS